MRPGQDRAAAVNDGHVTRLLADLELASDGDPAEFVQQLCDRLPVAVAVTGTAVTVIGDGHSGVVAVSNPVAQRLEEIQLTLGEGPGLDAFAEHGAVLVPDLHHDGRWSGYATEALGVGVQAVFAVPLQMGSIKIGALTLHRERPGALNAHHLNRTFDVAELIGHMLLLAGSATDADGLSLLWADLDEDWTVVHQATGMVSVQLGVGVDVALIRLRSHSFAEGRRVVDIAHDIVARRLRLARDDNAGSL